MRTVARETLFKIIFASQFNKPVEEGFKHALYKADNLDEKDINYCEGILNTVEEHGEDFTRILDERSKLFPESRLFPADRSVLFIALAEMLCLSDVPSAVSINEAANIAAKYSSEKSASFVSGLLAEILREGINVQGN